MSDSTRRSKRRAPVRPPAPEWCEFCLDVRARRRGICWNCYRKFCEAGLPLPLRLADRKGDPIEAWAHMLTRAQAQKILGVLKRRVARPRRAREFIDGAQQVLGGVR